MESVPRKNNTQENKSSYESIVLALGLERSKDGNFTIPDIDNMEKPTKLCDDLEYELLMEKFEGFNCVDSEPVTRPLSDTTLFTTSGVQRIETMLNNTENILDKEMVVFQPVLRSQFIDGVKEGYSSSFLNLSIIKTSSEIRDVVSMSKKMISLIACHTELGRNDLTINFEENNAFWGENKFRNIVISFSVRGVEVGECVYISDFPINEQRSVNIIDIGIGLERFSWALRGNSSFYFGKHSELYLDLIEQKYDIDKVAKIIDPLRSMTLLAMENVEPSNKNHGYRLRQLSKRFIQHSHTTKINIENLIKTSYEEWSKWGHKSICNIESVINLIKQENDRNFNRLILNLLQEESGLNLYININQDTQSFLEQINFSVDKSIINNILSNTNYEI